MYEEFITEIMPTVISVIDVTDVAVLDNIFTLFSFSFKYLLKPIRDDLVRFYTIYQEVLVHSNKHIRMFASQSFSYILRKTDVSLELLSLIVRPLKSEGSSDLSYDVTSPTVLHGISDILFEVMYGVS